MYHFRRGAAEIAYEVFRPIEEIMSLTHRQGGADSQQDSAEPPAFSLRRAENVRNANKSCYASNLEREY
jgi:hypothetical protein